MDKQLNGYKSKKKITVPKGYRFFGDTLDGGDKPFLTEFEPNSFNVKGITGCGATTMLLENHQPMILAFPTKELCNCKSESKRHKGKVFWFKKGVTDTDLQNYISTVEVPKFIVVYDRLQQLYETLDTIDGVIVGNDYVLAVDEAHLLLTALSYREEAINQLKNLLPQFDNVQFITATPVPEEYAPAVLKGYNYIEYVWEDAERITVKGYEHESPLGVANALIRMYRKFGSKLIVRSLDDTESYDAKELIFFVNSVDAIVKVIRTCKIKRSECKVVVADKYQNLAKLAKAFNCDTAEFTTDNASSPNKSFTFVTSRAFEGVDFHSDTALSIVISEVNSEHTLLDVGIDLTQIAGRIRTLENKLRNQLMFIYNGFGINSEEHFENIITEEEGTLNTAIAESRAAIVAYEALSNEHKDALFSFYSKSVSESLLLLKQIDGEKIVELDLDKISLKKYKLYLILSYLNGSTVENRLSEELNFIDISDRLSVDDYIDMCAEKVAFKDMVSDYVSKRKCVDAAVQSSVGLDGTSIRNSARLLIAMHYDMPILYEAYETVGAKEMQTSANASKKDLEGRIEEYRIRFGKAHSVHKTFEHGKFYTNKQVKSMLEGIYKQHKINVTATDIKLYFEAESKRRTVDKSRKHGFVIGKPKTLNAFSASINGKAGRLKKYNVDLSVIIGDV